eukprot:TRINITY_DN9900_c0_g1_i1.p1 TRINITY_DN9900_c0_g1~~TRINITY_DN9900_c0_g1_i1.p1  ORF type:complete len:118 (+),score=21.08 TRINITY_DN9900_c0_g1_i1:223-576(+)
MNVIKWKEDVNNKVFFPGTEDPIPTILLCNKVDLVEDPQYTDSELDTFCEHNGFLHWFKTSAKQNIGVDESLNFFVPEILKRLEAVPKESVKEDNDSNAFPLEKKQGPDIKKKNCDC